VTFLIGENGTGKSTLLEAVAIAAGFNAEGGSRNFRFATRDTHSSLSDYIRLVRGIHRPKDGFFLRAETFYNAATYLETEVPDALLAYGDRSLHQRSHGEAFMALLTERFRGKGLYILDEPEAALSPTRQMALLSLLHALVKKDSQFLIATHSPIIMAYPGSRIYVLSADGIRETPYDQTEHYVVARDFFARTGAIVQELLSE
jgi:predicted ATPase